FFKPSMTHRQCTLSNICSTSYLSSCLFVRAWRSHGARGESSEWKKWNEAKRREEPCRAAGCLGRRLSSPLEAVAEDDAYELPPDLFGGQWPCGPVPHSRPV